MASNHEDFTAWVDPDVLEEYDGKDIGYDRESEQQFKDFFITGWADPKYDDIREHWDSLIHDKNPRGRLYGKIALWSLVRLRNLQAGTPLDIDKSDQS